MYWALKWLIQSVDLPLLLCRDSIQLSRVHNEQKTLLMTTHYISNCTDFAARDLVCCKRKYTQNFLIHWKLNLAVSTLPTYFGHMPTIFQTNRRTLGKEYYNLWTHYFVHYLFYSVFIFTSVYTAKTLLCCSKLVLKASLLNFRP